MEKFYHFTRKNLLINVFIRGLIVNSEQKGIGNGRTYHKNFGMQPIFLTNDYQHVVDTMLGNEVKNFVLLEVNVKNISLEPEIYTKIFLPGKAPPWNKKDYICRIDIPSDRIKTSTIPQIYLGQ